MRLFILSVFVVSLLSGCASINSNNCSKIETVMVPVYEKPKFDMPEKPIVTDIDENASIGLATRTLILNFEAVSTYASKLEEILNALK